MYKGECLSGPWAQYESKMRSVGMLRGGGGGGGSGAACLLVVLAIGCASEYARHLSSSWIFSSFSGQVISVECENTFGDEERKEKECVDRAFAWKN